MSSRSSTLDLNTCEAEPIHIPGRVQPHGVLLALDEPGLTIRQASANAGEQLGLEASQLLGQSITALLSDDLRASFVASLADPDPRPFAPFRLAVAGRPFDAIAHRHGGRLIVELEPGQPVRENVIPDRLVQFTLANQRSGLGLQEFCAAIAREVRTLTGYDRVMVYRFDPDWNGEVFAEAKRDDLEPFQGLHYPASDIPAQARRLYHLNLVRHIPDITYSSSPLVPELDPATEQPLDLSQAVLRSVSPIHVEYLQNMGVLSTLTVSLLKDGRLWGLIACHHYAPLFLSYRMRAACESLGVLVSLQLSAKQDAEELLGRVAAQTRLGRLLTALTGPADWADTLMTHADDLLGLTRAAGAALVIGSRIARVGATPGDAEIQCVAAWLRAGDHAELATATLPNAIADVDTTTASGLLAVRLGASDYLMWFRPETAATVHWAGDPFYKRVVFGPNGPRLSPRGSFTLWKETQRGKSELWDTSERDVSRELRDAIQATLARRSAGLDAEARRRDDFLAGVAHELRGPLGPIRNAAELIRLAPGQRDITTSAAEIIARQVGQLARIVDDLLDASRAGRGKLRVTLERLELAGMIRAAAEDARRALESAGVTLEVRLPTRPVYIQGDAVRLAQVVGNLLGNADKFTDRGGRVTVELTATEKQALLTVTDTGVGIAPGDLPRLFDAFAQADGTVHRSRDGLGLGLSLVKAITELHGGDVRAASEGSGCGATFTVRLPLDGCCSPRDLYISDGPDPRA